MAQNLSNLPIGAKIKFGSLSVNGEIAQPIRWVVVAKNHYMSSSVTLFAEKVIDYQVYDAVEPMNTDLYIPSRGDKRYAISNIQQWLNSVETNWYSARHSLDTVDAAMAARPGFLHHFTASERNAVLTTTVKSVWYDYINSSTKEDSVSGKVFLPSHMELGLLNGQSQTNSIYGSAWGYPTNVEQLRGYITQQLADYSPYSLNIGESISYWTRGTNGYEVDTVYAYVNFNGTILPQPARLRLGVRPAINLSSTLSISDTTDSDGCYTAVWNQAPPAPTTLNVPTIYGGKAFTISWGKVTDPDGQAVTYQLEQSVNGGTFTTIYTGTNLAYTTTIAKGSTSVQFRLKATDALGASGGYLTSANKTVINNNAPVISGSDGSLGTKGGGFTQTYTITDTESNTVTVKESIDGVQIRSYVATLGATNTFSVTGNTWLALANGNHTLTITATDGVDSSVRTYSFTKSVNSFTIQNSTPMAASTRPTRIKVIVNKTIPAEATFKVEVCNNGYDSSPAWEDATTSMNSGLVHLFSNTTKTATNWGVRIRVTVNRNGGSGACYVSSIGGNWE